MMRYIVLFLLLLNGLRMPEANACDTARVTVDLRICKGDSAFIGNNPYSETGIFEDTLLTTEGCDSIVTLNLTVIQPIIRQLSESICAGDSFIVGNKSYFSSGLYTDTLLSSNNCDSIVFLQLNVVQAVFSQITSTICAGDTFNFGNRNLVTAGFYTDTLTAFSGCDSIVGLQLNVIPPVVRQLNVSICPGDTFRVGNSAYTIAGVYRDTLLSFRQCDSIIVTSLGVLPLIQTTLNRAICQGGSFNFNNQTLNSSGQYSDTLTAANGCDSIIILNLTVNPVFNINLQPVICQGQSFTVGNKTYTQSGNYKDTLKTKLNCDSIITTQLLVNPVPRVALNPVICSGDSFAVGTKVYKTTGTYRDTLVSYLNCDSIITTQLQVVAAFNRTIRPAICEGDTFSIGNSTYFISGTYKDTLKSNVGCDSIVTTILTVFAPATINLTKNICQGDTFRVGNNAYTISGNYSDTLASFAGCDSIVNLQLNVIAPIIRNQQPRICAGTTFTVGNNTYNISGIYRDTLSALNGCDSIVITQLTVLPINTVSLNPTICRGQTFSVGNKTYSVSGTYIDTLKNINNCDSIITTQLTVVQAQTFNIQASICSGSTYVVGENSYSQSGTYRDTLKNSIGCDSIIVLQLSVRNSLTGSLTTSICNGDSIKMGDNFYSLAGIYKDTLPSSGGCDSIVTLTLSIRPVFNQNINRSICNGDSLLFGNQYLKTSGQYSFQFTSSRNCDSTVNLNLNVIPTSLTTQRRTACEGKTIVVEGVPYARDTTFSFTYTNANGCDSIIQYELRFNPLSFVSLSPVICKGDFFENIKINQDTTIVRKLLNINGCDSTVTISITAKNPSFTTLKSNICIGTRYRNILIQKDTIIRQVFNDIYGCDSTVTDTVVALQNPVLIISKDTLINPGQSITIFASGAATYNWNTGNTQSAFSVSPVEKTIYTVIGTAQNGCKDTASVIVDVNACSIKIPTLFSPNADGSHDFLVVRGLECLSDYRLQIVNRWGDVVFETNDKAEQWDGTFKGNNSPEGTYFVIISGRKALDGAAINESGYLHLKR